MRAFVALLLLAPLVLSGCLGNKDTATPTPAANNSTAMESGMMPMLATVELGESGPTPAPTPGSMYLKATGMDALVVGMPVNLTIKNTGGSAHDLVIPDLGFSSGDIAGGASKTVVLTPTKAGTFDMYCDKGAPDPTGTATHRGAGMAGKVTVKAAA